MTSSDSALTRTGQFMGTVAYAAPEQFQGRPSDAATDLYSLGCVAYECLTGERPYPREQEAAVMFAHLQEPPPMPSKVRPGLPPAVDGVVAKAMAKAPEERFASGKALGAAFRSAIGVEGSTPPGGISSRPQAAPAFPGPATGSGSGPGSSAGPPRRRGAVIAALVAVAVVLAAVAVIVLGGGSSKDKGGGTPSATGSNAASASPSSASSGGPSSSASGAPPGLAIEVDTVAKLDPSTGEVLADYPVGSNPGAVAVSGGAVWIINDDDQTISKVDIATGGVTTRGGIADPCWVFPAPQGRVWISSCDAGVVQEIDPVDREVVARLHVPSPRDVVQAAGSVWVVSNRGRFDPSWLYRFTPAGKLEARIKLHEDASDIAVTEDGTLWGGDGGDGTLWHVDPATNSAEFVPGWTSPGSVTADGSNLWVSDEEPNSVTEWDSLRRQADTLIRDHAGTIVVEPGVVWIQDGFYDTLTRIDPSSGAVTADFQLGYSSDMVEGGGFLWITAGSD